MRAPLASQGRQRQALRHFRVCLPMNADIQLLPFSPALAADFRRLNLAWIETFFQVEATDVEQLSHPERILANGGELWFAMAADETVGTGALVHCGGGDYELGNIASNAPL